MNKNSRLKKLEEKIGVSDFGLRVVIPIECFYPDKVGIRYWTDEPFKSIESFYDDEPYRKVKHPVYGFDVPSGMV